MLSGWLLKPCERLEPLILSETFAIPIAMALIWFQAVYHKNIHMHAYV